MATGEWKNAMDNLLSGYFGKIITHDSDYDRSLDVTRKRSDQVTASSIDVFARIFLWIMAF